MVRITDEGRRLAAALRQIRREQGLTQAQVAEAWGMSVDGYRPYEAGRRQLRTSALHGLAAALGVSQTTLAARLGLHGSSAHEIRLSECRDLVSQLNDEPQEVVDAVMRMRTTSWLFGTDHGVQVWAVNEDHRIAASILVGPQPIVLLNQHVIGTRHEGKALAWALSRVHDGVPGFFYLKNEDGR